MEKQQASTLTMPVTPEATSATLALLYAKDADFRAEFDKDPKAAITKASGQEVPSNVEIVVHRNDPKRWHITLPVEGMDAALGDADMENIAGGTGAPGDIAGAALGFASMALGICGGVCGQQDDPTGGPMGALIGLAAVTAATAVAGSSGTTGG